MKSIHLLEGTSALLALLTLLSTTTLVSQTPPDDKEKQEGEPEEFIVLSPFEVSTSGSGGYASAGTLAGTRLGATVGGAKDTLYFRDAVKRGGFPHPSTITAEGLFSEHDLPLREPTSKARDLLVIAGECMPSKLLTQPETRYLAQIGFSSSLEEGVWQRDPLNLVAVVDKSGSMSGAPLDLVKKSLQKILLQLGEKDQLSIVLYGDRSHVHLSPTLATAANREVISDAIEAIESAGSTNMEEGLKVGFELARASQRSFHGRTRVMQFTDERPNVGDTSAEGFMGLMRAASRDGIGQTTIGVGVQFGAELAATISSVRGGNLYFFPNEQEMIRTMTEELDTLVTELAYDMKVTVQPAPGLRVVGLYGVPNELLEWEGERAVSFSVKTLFISHRKGGIFLALAPVDENLPTRIFENGSAAATVSLAYQEIGKTSVTRSNLRLPMYTRSKASIGLVRGEALVNEVLTLKAAMAAHLTENNQSKALGLLEDFGACLAANPDAALTKERELVSSLVKALGKLAGHGEVAVVDDDEMVELPCFYDFSGR